MLCGWQSAVAITANDLADIVEQMELAISDISVEYEWLTVPPLTNKEGESQMGVEVLIPKDGCRTFNLHTAGLLNIVDPNTKGEGTPERFLLEESTVLVTKDGNSWLNMTKQSYNGQIGKYLNIGGWPEKMCEGAVIQTKPFVVGNGTPLGFSVFRCVYDSDKVPLSARLRKIPLVRIDNTIQKVNGFNTIRADFLQQFTKHICRRICFSVDHGYTPVKFDYMTCTKPEYNKVSLSFIVQSLSKIGENLWFPTSGIISKSGSNKVDMYQATGSVIINQGLATTDFDIDFPVGTKVHDKIQDREYTVK